MQTEPTNNQVTEEDHRTIAAAEIPWHRLANKSILVTGGAGFLPAYLIECLLSVGDIRGQAPKQVTAVVRNQARGETRFANLAARKNFALVTQDLGTYPMQLPPADFIIHCASQASPKYFGTDPVGTLAPNVIGTQALLQHAKTCASEAVLFFSSSEVYGRSVGEPHPWREKDTGHVDIDSVRSCYAESKRMGEVMCVSWHQQHGVPAKIVRPFHTYGPGMRLDDGRVFCDFVANVLAKRDIVMKSAGSAVRAYCYLSDATEGFLKVLLQGDNGQAYNVGNDGCAVSVLELAETLANQVAQTPMRVVRQQRSEGGYMQSAVDHCVPDTSRLRALGWAPKVGLVEGFSRTVRSFS